MLLHLHTGLIKRTLYAKDTADRPFLPFPRSGHQAPQIPPAAGLDGTLRLRLQQRRRIGRIARWR